MAYEFSDDEVNKILHKHFNVFGGNDRNKDFSGQLQNFEVHDTDVFLVGHAKSGTTWAQEMIWLIANDLNFDGAKTFVDERFPVFEFFTFCERGGKTDMPEYYSDSLGFIERMKDPRLTKSHLPGPRLPRQTQDGSRKAKIIYVARNVKDVCLSFYHYTKNINIFTGDLGDFCKIFIAGKVSGGSYWNHVMHFWERRNEENILFLKFEDMKNNMPQVILKVASFLNKNLSEQQVTTLSNWLDFESMKKNPAVNHNNSQEGKGEFIRKGKVNSFKDEMPAEWIETFDVWIKKCTEGSGLDTYMYNED